MSFALVTGVHTCALPIWPGSCISDPCTHLARDEPCPHYSQCDSSRGGPLNPRRRLPSPRLDRLLARIGRLVHLRLDGAGVRERDLSGSRATVDRHLLRGRGSWLSAVGPTMDLAGGSI